MFRCPFCQRFLSGDRYLAGLSAAARYLSPDRTIERFQDLSALRF